MSDITFCSFFIPNSIKDWYIIRFNFSFVFVICIVFCIVFVVLFVNFQLFPIIERSHLTPCNTKSKFSIDIMSQLMFCFSENMHFHNCFVNGQCLCLFLFLYHVRVTTEGNYFQVRPI